MHFIVYVGILLPMVTAISVNFTASPRLESSSVNLTASPRLEERENSESIWLPVDCPPGHYYLEPGKSKRHTIENEFDRRYQTGGVYVCTQAN